MSLKLDQPDNPLGINYSEEPEEVYLKLNCIDCEFVECKIAKKYVKNDSKEGCTRKVPEQDAAKFYHYIEEVIPFWKMYPADHIAKSYNQIIEFFYDYIYTAPITQRLDPRGKVKASGY